MKIFNRIVMAVAFFAVTGCGPLMYGKLDSPSVQVTDSSFKGVPGGVDLSITQLLPPATFNIGDMFGFDLSASAMKDSSLKLNAASLALTSASGNFSGVNTAALIVSSPTGQKQTIAQYTKGSVGTLSPDGKTISFAATSDLELFSYLQNKSLTVSVSATGVGPSSAWDAAITLDFKVTAQYNVL
jgi:hypothetical protein